MSERRACIVNVNDLKVGDRLIDELAEVITPPLVTTLEDGCCKDAAGTVYPLDHRKTVVVLR